MPTILINFGAEIDGILETIVGSKQGGGRWAKDSSYLNEAKNPNRESLLYLIWLALTKLTASVRTKIVSLVINSLFKSPYILPQLKF